jgi:hypothetical protein
MYKQIQRLFQNFNGTTLLNENIHSSKTTLGNKINEIIAFNHIQRLIPKEVYVSNTGWSSSYVMIQHILNVIDVNPTFNILEFGVGNSSLFIASSLQDDSRENKYYGIDNSNSWAELYEGKIIKLNSKGNCKVVHAAITDVDQLIWYDRRQIEKNLKEFLKFGIVIIDGPYGKISNNIRSNGVDFIKEKLDKDYVIFVDDTIRSDGKLLVSKLCEGLNDSNSIIDFGRYTVISNMNIADQAPSQIW